MTINSRGGMGWFERRWEQMQNENISSLQSAVSELGNNFVELEKTMLYVVAKLALDQPIGLEDPVLRQFLHLDEEDPRRGALELIAHFSAKRGGQVDLVDCPHCGAKVKDIKGVTDEVCTWCGHQLTTAD